MPWRGLAARLTLAPGVANAASTAIERGGANVSADLGLLEGRIEGGFRQRSVPDTGHEPTGSCANVPGPSVASRQDLNAMHLDTPT